MEKKKVKLKIPSKLGMVEIEGSPEAIELIIKSINPTTTPTKFNNNTIKGLILKLIEKGFFDKPKKLGEIKKQLQLMGFNKPTSSIFAILQRDFLRKDIIHRKGSRKSYEYFVETD